MPPPNEPSVHQYFFARGLDMGAIIMYPEMKRDFAEKMNQMIRALLKETESNQYKHLVQNMHNKEEKK